tara:strand:+ start:11123 stop:11875 length:753 start_codon:yes stop_codon:yes gene_type:complete
MNINIFENSSLGSQFVANRIGKVLAARNLVSKPTVLGLATGSTPIEVYDELIKKYRNEGLSFKNVVTFNLDEYYPMEPSDVQSYYYFMHQNLFNAIDIQPSNVFIPNGEIHEHKIIKYCEQYDDKIAEVGGIDIQILGIGANGHIGFNEPGSERKSATRFVTLDEQTRKDASYTFNGIENVPESAITMGIDTILKAKEILILAWGKRKAEIIKQCLFGEVTSTKPATFLQAHPNVNVVLDVEAASLLDLD